MIEAVLNALREALKHMKMLHVGIFKGCWKSSICPIRAIFHYSLWQAHL